MSNEIKNNVLSNILTVIATGVVSTFGFWFNSELDTYKEMKAALPEIKEINIVRQKMEDEYSQNKKKTASTLWTLKQEIKKTKEKENEHYNRLLKLRAKDSVYIHYNYYYVKSWVNEGH
jgi:predicted ATP-dependent protease